MGRRSIAVAFVFCCLILAVFALHHEQDDSLIVQTSLGSVKGNFATINGVRVRTWGSIPYAASTDGENRFRRPQPRTKWNDTLDATHYSKLPTLACYQPPDPRLTLSEDCLVVNVVAPLNSSSSSKLPVMVWIHGGSLRNGAGGLYDGSWIVSEWEVVFVSLNYRVGFLGYMALKELEDDENEGEGGVLGNYGFLDQLAALDWVQQNAAVFGGDPNSVTIFGESAGGTSVGSHLTSPLSVVSPPHFHRAIIQSGQSSFAWSRDEALSLSHRQLTQMSDAGTCCTSESGDLLVKCLRAVAPDTFVSTTMAVQLNFAHTMDGTVIVDTASNMMARGEWLQVPLLQGTLHDEMSAFLCPTFDGNFSIVNHDDAVYALSRSFSNASLIDAMLQEYPVSHFQSSQWLALVALETDVTFRCAAKASVHAAATATNSSLFASFSSSSSSTVSNVYMYSLELIPGYTTPCKQIAHAMELPLLFPSSLPFYNATYVLTEEEQAFARSLRQAWATFALTGTLQLNVEPSVTPTTSDVSIPSYCSEGDDKDEACSETYVKLVSPSDGWFAVERGFYQQPCSFYFDNVEAIRSALIVG